MTFFSFEGIDGSGKTTQAELLVERLNRSGCPAVLFREPGGTELSERIRSLLLDSTLHIHAFAELLLFSSARVQLVQERIRPALQDGTVVVCDRFIDSTTAYQGGGRDGIDRQWLMDFNRRVTGGLMPARTYYIAVDPALAMRRARSRNRKSEEEMDRMEAAGDAFYARVADAYEQLAQEEDDRILRIDGSRTIEEIAERIWEDARHYLNGTAESA